MTDYIDVELTSEIWYIERKPVLLQFDHYELRYSLTDALEWGALVPYDGLVHVLDESSGSWETYMLSMFHQLRCLDVLREQILLPLEDRNIPRSQHCLNYLRQTILCRGDMHLESFRAQTGTARETVERRGTYRCRDFRAVYNAIEVNHENYTVRMASTGNVSAFDPL